MRYCLGIWAILIRKINKSSKRKTKQRRRATRRNLLCHQFRHQAKRNSQRKRLEPVGDLGLLFLEGLFQSGVEDDMEALRIDRSQMAVVWLRIISILAWLDSALIGKDAKLSSTFSSGQGLIQSVTENFEHSAVTSGVAGLLQNVVVPHAQIVAALN